MVIERASLSICICTYIWSDILRTCWTLFHLDITKKKKKKYSPIGIENQLYFFFFIVVAAKAGGLLSLSFFFFFSSYQYAYQYRHFFFLEEYFSSFYQNLRMRTSVQYRQETNCKRNYPTSNFMLPLKHKAFFNAKSILETMKNAFLYFFLLYCLLFSVRRTWQGCQLEQINQFIFIG